MNLATAIINFKHYRQANTGGIGRFRIGHLLILRSPMVFLVCLVIGLAPRLMAANVGDLQLAPTAEVDGRGVFLREVVKTSQSLPSVRLCDSPQFGKTINLTRAQINELLGSAAPDLVISNWSGANTVEISRRTHLLTEVEMLDLLTSALQKNYVKDRGELELDLTQPWDAPTVPDESLTAKILESPAHGVSPLCIIRFELCTTSETIGTWQVSLHAHVWRNVWVAHSDLNRGQSLGDADVDQERRDVLEIHEPLAQFSADDSALELAESVPSGNVLMARDLKPRTVLHRGQMADALLQDGALNIMLKVEVLEDASLGQIVRVRNPVSLRNLSGKVINDQTVSISL